MNSYLSGYVTLTRSPDNDFSIKGKNFILRLVKQTEEKIVGGREVVIDCANETIANRVSKLIFASLHLLSSYSNFLPKYPPVIKPYGQEVDLSKAVYGIPTQISNPDILLACKIACKVSFRKKYIYSLFKYQLACLLHSNPIVDLDPTMGGYFSLSPFEDDHIRLGYAIVLFYSILEELGVEIRASQKKPSRLPDGKWNPVVKGDLEERLRKLKINIDEPVYWDLRGTPNKIERSKRPQIIGKADWAYGAVRDGQMQIIDAIAYISWIRSRVVAHKVNDLIGSLSIYNVSNANYLAQRILLETLGFWNAIKQGANGA